MPDPRALRGAHRLANPLWAPSTLCCTAQAGGGVLVEATVIGSKANTPPPAVQEPSEQQIRTKWSHWSQAAWR